ncbi:hypothetical protein QYF36_006077 [Acer negundo]|nr:hypothetical protein QYF36_006077 [Acer negundo]
MDSGVLEFDIGVGGATSSGGGRDGDDDTIDISHPVDEEDMDDSPLPISCDIYMPEGDFLDLEPSEGMEFESEEAAKAFYNSYARRVGFSTRVSSSRRSRRDGAIIQRQFVCAKEGFRNLNEKRTKDREIKRPRTITRVGCKASLSVKMQDSGKWVVSEELVGTLTLTASKAEDDGEIITYKVAKYGEDKKAYYVNFNVLEMKASCSCQMFEFSGLLCGHVLAVFRVTNVLTLPSYYILKRWTRNAKSSVILEERANDVYTSYLESHTVRYNTLRHEAFKFVDEGAKSLDTYNVAVAALQEAAKRVALATTRNEGRTNMVNGHIRGNLASDANRANNSSANHQGNSSQPLSEDDMDNRFQELTNELDFASRKSSKENIAFAKHGLQIRFGCSNNKIGFQLIFGVHECQQTEDPWRWGSACIGLFETNAGGESCLLLCSSGG